MRTIVICLDGTWQEIHQDHPTNVVLTVRAIAKVQPNGAPPLIYYDEGVGVARGALPWLGSKIGGAFGTGLDDKIEAAYRFLCLNYVPGDRLYVFGFSRGAFIARSLCGLLHHVGLVTRANVFHTKDAIALYRKLRRVGVAGENFSADSIERQRTREEMRRFQGDFCTPNIDRPWITYLGVWDTVKALGILEKIPGSNVINRRHAYHLVDSNESIARLRHAVSIDERRDAFPPVLYDAVGEDWANKRYEQVWFAGDHGHIGGGATRSELSSIPLVWILEAAQDSGLMLDPRIMGDLKQQAQLRENFTRNVIAADKGFGKLCYDLAGYSARTGIRSTADLHESVIHRLSRDSGYQPEALKEVIRPNAMLARTFDPAAEAQHTTMARQPMVTFKEAFKYILGGGDSPLTTIAGALTREAKFNDADKRVAWRIFIELQTRVSTQPLKDEDGSEKSALDSLYKLFQIMREELREGGPEAKGAAVLGLHIINTVLRPFTAKWHMRLQPKSADPKETVELTDPKDKADFRAELRVLQDRLRRYVATLSNLLDFDPDADLPTA